MNEQKLKTKKKHVPLMLVDEDEKSDIKGYARRTARPRSHHNIDSFGELGKGFK
jgi:hypothetical protein